jgi:uroporphyrinogen-III synthase
VKVWVTRDEDERGPLCTALRGAGLTPVLEPVLQRRVVDDASDVIARLKADDWLVLTSPYAVEAVAADPARVPRVAVVSEPSRRAAEARGFRVELVSPRGDGKSLFEVLRVTAKSGTVCYPRSALAKEPQPWPGVELVSPVLYETVARAFDATVIDRVDVIAVASPSAVDAILEVDAGLRCDASSGSDRRRVPWPSPGEAGRRHAPQRALRFASIGPTTSAALRKHGIEPWLEAPEPSFEALAEAIAAYRTDSRHHLA